ncbi:uncharacterized protein CPUR_05032 [Claviceps purpurea 20.1]|uniref:Uncharacterized protein n=1 Tax=Claviceps purpurea (strain 20.1) TaxID=1111077 RepID=M1W1R0_CLAP2|nr:hypothetical protein E4U50_007116 [Claviceps purpurea]CCE31181.1 uncharacterized protein CPUR_05032 [Claviceps purpurea 20.1]
MLYYLYMTICLDFSTTNFSEPGSEISLLERPALREISEDSGHETFAGVDEPTSTHQLTAAGLKPYDREIARYKTLLRNFSILQHQHELEVKSDTLT